MSTRSRVLCSHCFQSFEPAELEDSSDRTSEPICPGCSVRNAERSAPKAEAGPDSPSGAISSPPVPLDREPSVSQRSAEESPRFFADAARWAAGRYWWARLPLWIYFAAVFGRHVFGSGPYRSLFDGINLGIHELGHAVFRPFGEFLHMSGGTILQLAAPVAAAVVFLRQRDYFGISVAGCWLATNFWGVAVYVADARALQLDLVAPGMGVMPAGEGGILHDWNHLLGPMGLLPYDQHIAFFFKSCAVLSMSAGLAFGAWLMFVMATRKSEQPSLWN